MKVTCQQISGWIAGYLNSRSSQNVLNRQLSDKLIHRLQCDRKDKETGENISQRWLKHIKENISAFDDDVSIYVPNESIGLYKSHPIWESYKIIGYYF